MLVARQMLFAITGRMKKPAVKKLNPIWWFGNDDEQQTADWYHPEWPRWRRDFYWNFLRNPLQNFRCFVIGVQDRNYTVTGCAPVMTVQRDDLGPPERGFQWCVIHTLIPLGFLSYSGKHVVWYIGWQPSGIFGVKFNLHLFRPRQSRPSPSPAPFTLLAASSWRTLPSRPRASPRSRGSACRYTAGGGGGAFGGLGRRLRWLWRRPGGDVRPDYPTPSALARL